MLSYFIKTTVIDYFLDLAQKNPPKNTIYINLFAPEYD